MDENKFQVGDILNRIPDDGIKYKVLDLPKDNINICKKVIPNSYTFEIANRNVKTQGFSEKDRFESNFKLDELNDIIKHWY